jgi:hypothetical protein
VGSLRQFGICVIETGGAAFDEVVARAWSAVLGAYKHGYYDTAAHQELIARYTRGLADDVDLSCYLNDRRTETRDDGPAAPPTAEDIRAARPRTTVHWGGREDTYDGTFYLHVEDVEDAIGYTLWGDTHRYPPARIERCARDLEATVIEAALSADQASVGAATPH